MSLLVCEAKWQIAPGPQVCVIDVDHAADVQALRDQGFEACFISLAPESSQTMLDNIQTALTQEPLPGYEPEDAASLLLQVMHPLTAAASK